MGRSARLRRAPLLGLRAFGTSPMEGLRHLAASPGPLGSRLWKLAPSMGRVRVPPPLRCALPAPIARARLRRSGGTRPRCGGPPGYSPGSPRICGMRPVPRRPRLGRGAWSPWALVRPLLARQFRPVASYLGPVPGSLVGPGRPSASPAGIPPGSSARPPAASYLRPRGDCARVPAPAGPPSAPVRAPSGRPSCAPAGLPSSGPPAGSPPPAASACRAGSRPSGARFGRPPPPRGVGGPRAPRWGGPWPVCVAFRPGAFALRRGAPAGAACFSCSCCQSWASPLLPPRSPSPAGGGGGHRARRVASPPEGSAFRGPLWAPPAPSGRCPTGAEPRR